MPYLCVKQWNNCQYHICSIADGYICKNQGKIYVDTFITGFKKNIADIFECGERENCAKITDNVVKAGIQRRHPDDYAIPQVPAVKSYEI